MEFDITATIPAGGMIDVDVHGGNGLLTVAHFNLRKLAGQLPRVTFNNPGGQDTLEFRVHFSANFFGEIVFRGVLISCLE